jgi:hypothetical protein
MTLAPKNSFKVENEFPVIENPRKGIPLNPSPKRSLQVYHLQRVTRVSPAYPAHLLTGSGVSPALSRRKWFCTSGAGMLSTQAYPLPPTSPVSSRGTGPALPGPTRPSPRDFPSPLLTVSWGWCPTPARQEWQWATPWPPTRLSALCTHWH